MPSVLDRIVDARPPRVPPSLEAAEEATRKNRVLTLSRDEQDRFIAAMIQPPAVVPALKRAVKAHREMIEPS